MVEEKEVDSGELVNESDRPFMEGRVWSPAGGLSDASTPIRHGRFESFTSSGASQTGYPDAGPSGRDEFLRNEANRQEHEEPRREAETPRLECGPGEEAAAEAAETTAPMDGCLAATPRDGSSGADTFLRDEANSPERGEARCGAETPHRQRDRGPSG